MTRSDSDHHAQLRATALHADRTSSEPYEAGTPPDLWLELLQGRSRVADNFHAHGRHFVVLSSDADRSLTRRERIVASLAAEGHSDVHVARTLGIAPPTVRTHLRRALAKLGISGRLALVEVASTLLPASAL